MNVDLCNVAYDVRNHQMCSLSVLYCNVPFCTESTNVQRCAVCVLTMVQTTWCAGGGGALQKLISARVRLNFSRDWYFNTISSPWVVGWATSEGARARRPACSGQVMLEYEFKVLGLGLKLTLFYRNYRLCMYWVFILSKKMIVHHGYYRFGMVSHDSVIMWWVHNILFYFFVFICTSTKQCTIYSTLCSFRFSSTLCCLILYINHNSWILKFNPSW